MTLAIMLMALAAAPAAREAGRGPVYSVVELSFQGPRLSAPASELDFAVRFRHASGSPEYRVYGFWDGGDVFKVRFTPTREGRWELAEVSSTAPELKGQRQGEHVTATRGRNHGFWVNDEASAGRRWYKRSDGSHQYIIGNTQYSFLSGYAENGKTGVDIAADVRRNAEYFKKLRFSLHCDRYPNPEEKPFLDEQGRPTDSGDYSHRPNPKWFRERVDVAVQAAYEADLIADLILSGPDTEDARSTLRASRNNGDPTPWLKYIAARYGSYPNVWICLANEYYLRVPKYTEEEIARFGAIMKRFLPYPTPLSAHPNWSTLWSTAFDSLPPWNDHQIIQRKLKQIAPAADVIHGVWENRGGSPRNKPTINDELSYEGAGDRHSGEDTVEAHLGAFLGGGYGSTGHKTGEKTGQYFGGGFDASAHTAAPGLKWLRETIDAGITFWEMLPDHSIFPGLDPAFRAMGWAGREYVLGTDAQRKGLVARLPEGEWTVTRYDVLRRERAILATAARGTFAFDAPASRAVLFHFRRNGRPGR